MIYNDFVKIKKEKEKEDSIIKNDDLFEQEGIESDDDQVILNEERDEECSFFSENAENELNKLNIMSNNLNTTNNDVINKDKNNIKSDNLLLEKNLKDIIDKNAVNKEEIKTNEENKKINDNLLLNNDKNEDKISMEIKVKDIENNNPNNKTDNGTQTQNNQSNTSKNYFSKKVIYKKNKVNKTNKINNVLPRNNDNIEKKSTNGNIIKKMKSNEKTQKKIMTEKREKSKNSYINRMKEKKSMKINYENHSRLWNNSSRNDEVSKSYIMNEKNNILSKSAVSYDKYGNKTVIKKRDLNKLYGDLSKNNANLIKVEKKLNRSYDNKFVNKRVNNNGNNNSSKNIKHYTQGTRSPNVTHKRINFTNAIKDKDNNNKVNKSSLLISKNSTKKSIKENNNKENKESNADGLKKVLMNKINKQISQIIQEKEKMYFNENNKLFFLGFCDILFELGFLHIKETEIKDITDIKNHIKDLYTQPFTNRTFLSENFLFNEQKLLICAWKTILNNFILIKEFNSLPEESEEITLDDCKLFIFIVTGLFIGFNNNYLKDNSHFKSERKPLKNKSQRFLNKDNSSKNFFNDGKLNKSYSKSSSNSKNKYHFRKKSDHTNMADSNNESNNSNILNENILNNILDNRKKSDYNYKNILKIKNYFTYFAELRKLYNLYKRDLKNINKKKVMEKDLTFRPKTNKNNKIILNKISPKMDFFQRNDLIKKRNEKKIIILQKERSQKLLKECTFDPLKNKHKKIEPLNPKEITNRLYHNHYNSQNLLNNSNPNLTCKHAKKIIFEKRYKEIFKFMPNTNKKFNREMFSKSPLDKDELLNKRIKDLREANLDRIINNYEKNTREVLNRDIKRDKNLMKEIIDNDKGGMKLDMEKRTNKDTFDNFQVFNFYNLPGFNNYFYSNDINEPLFSVEIKIKQNIKTIEVYPDDIPEKLAYDFCVENMLGKGSYEKIVNIIKDKLDEINKGNFNENVDINDNENGNENTNDNNETNKTDNRNNENEKEDTDNKLDSNKKENDDKDIKDNKDIKENTSIKENNNDKENVDEMINKNNYEIINMKIDLNDNEINNEDNVNINNINQENNIKDEYINNLDDNDICNSTEKIKEEINQINKNYSEEEKKNATNEEIN